MKEGLRAERKGLLLAFLSLGLIGAFAVLPTHFRSTASVEKKTAAWRTESHQPGMENYDIRTDKSDVAEASRREFRARSGKSESFAAQQRTTMQAGEKSLLKRFPNVDVQYSRELGNAEIISPRVGLSGAEKLTEPTAIERSQRLRSFVKENSDLIGVNDQQIANLKVAADSANPNGDAAFVILEQEINGIPVFRGELTAGFSKRGELLRVVNSLAPGVDEASVSTEFGAPEEAVRAAFKNVSRPMTDEDVAQNQQSSTDRKTIFGNGTFTTTAEKMYFPTEAGVVRPAWRVLIWEKQAAYYVIVDAETGTMLWRKNIYEDQTQTATFNVYANTTSLAKALDSPAPRSPGPTNPALGLQGLLANRTDLTLVGSEAGYDINFNRKGWIADGGNSTDGMNVLAGVDRDATDGVDAPITGSPNRVFTTTNPAWNPPPGNPGPGDDPLSAQAQRGAVIQMFYVANRFHDVMYSFGFNEAARNFQKENFSGQGSGGDAISAEGQDISGVNNARFGTAADGSPGKMEMFIWNGPNPDYDGTTDAEIMLHELTHGLSNRLHSNASGMTTSMARGMGEGWSDFYSLSLLSEPTDSLNGVYAMGGYATYLGAAGYAGNYYYGIRRFPKAVMSATGGPNNRPHNGLTFGHLNSNCNDNINNISAYARGPFGATVCDQVHNAGEIWSTALWEVRGKLIQQYGQTEGTRRALLYVTDGMKRFDPPNPTMLQSRDSILASAADLNPSDVALIWQGFAMRGMGYTASIQQSDSPAAVTEAFDLPNVVVSNGFSFSDAAPGGDGDGFAEPGETIVLNVPLVNNTGSTITDVSLNVNGSSVVNFGSVANSATVTKTISFKIPDGTACGSALNLNFSITGSAGPRTETRTLRLGVPTAGFTQNFDASTSLPTGWTQTATGSNPGWSVVSSSSDSTPNSVFTPDVSPGGGADLTSPVFILDSSSAILNFRHKFNTEKSWDGGLLEISISGAPFQEITAAGGTFITGGYTGKLDGNGNPLIGKTGWTGNSADIAGNTNGYITTSIQLPAAANGVAIQLKWRMGHDNSASVVGWNIDTVSVVFNYVCNFNTPTTTKTVRADFDGDGKTDRTVFRSGMWHELRSQGSAIFSQNWGLPTDITVSGDFDGDRKADPAVFRPTNGTWYILRSSDNTVYAINWGQNGDVPVPGDYNGDGKDDVAIFRNGLWAVSPTGGGAQIFQNWGQTGDKPVSGKYDADAKTDFAVFRNGIWYILNSSNSAVQAVNWGINSDTLVPGDYTGDGIDDLAVFRSGVWYIRTLGGTISSINWGQNGDVPTPGDYDGDGKIDAAVFRSGVWYVSGSTSGYNATGWGQTGDTPIPANYTK